MTCIINNVCWEARQPLARLAQHTYHLLPVELFRQLERSEAFVVTQQG